MLHVRRVVCNAGFFGRLTGTSRLVVYFSQSVSYRLTVCKFAQAKKHRRITIICPFAAPYLRHKIILVFLHFQRHTTTNKRSSLQWVEVRLIPSMECLATRGDGEVTYTVHDTPAPARKRKLLESHSDSKNRHKPSIFWNEKTVEWSERVVPRADTLSDRYISVTSMWFDVVWRSETLPKRGLSAGTLAWNHTTDLA